MIMKTTLQILAVTSLLLLYTGCAGTVSVVKTGKGIFPPTAASEIDILKTKPERPYEELGVVDAMDFPIKGVAKMHNALRAKAAPLGATAVIITDEGLINNGWSLVRFCSGAAIRYR
jgi:hypothetical protein